MNYVRAAKELPRMSDEEVDARAKEYGFSSASDEEVGVEIKEKEDGKEEVI